MTLRQHAPARPCTVPGCPHLVRGASRCPDHAIEVCPRRSRPDHRSHAQTTTARGYSTLWRRLVALAIAHHPACMICGSDQDLTGDHIVPLSKGGTSTAENIRVLCRRCNSRKGAR